MSYDTSVPCRQNGKPYIASPRPLLLSFININNLPFAQLFIVLYFDSYDSVTLMFSGIVGFGQYCAANTDPEGAMKIVKMLNELYTVFDALTDSKRNLNVYKVSANTHPI